MAKKTSKNEIKEVVKPAEIEDETQPKPFVKPRYIFGRPTKYKPEFCQAVVEYMTQGFSLKACAGYLCTTYDSINDWMKIYPDFFHAVKDGQALAALWWEQKLMENADSGKGNASSCIFGVKNRSQEQWKDKHEVDNTSSDGTMTAKPTTINIFGEQPKNHDE